MAAPTFETMVRENGSITLGEAKQFAQALPAEKQKTFCGLYTIVSPQCPGICICLSCPINLCCCVAYFPFLCACPADTPGTWSCTDMKGITYNLVPVDEKGTMAFFSEQEMIQGHGDALKVGCYCRKVC